jgi:two-component system sensor histidine kinase BarA
MNNTYTKRLSTRILLAFLSLVIVLGIAALFVRDSISKKLETISTLAHNAERDQSRPEQALLLLHKAEDDFQQSLISNDSRNLIAYQAELSEAFGKIDTLLAQHTDTTDLNAAQRRQVKNWYGQKLQLSTRLYNIKHHFDSLLTNFQAVDTSDAIVHIGRFGKTSSSNNTVSGGADTTLKTIKKNKGLLGRLKDAITNKNNTASIIEINHRHNNRLIDSLTRIITKKNRGAYLKILKQLQQHNKTVLNTQKQLITLNIQIINQLERVINDLKDINHTLANQIKGMAFQNYQDTTWLLNKFFLIALFLVVAFATWLIVFILKLDRSEVNLRKENERAIVLAQQKMDLLAHMSHEIRNPLTAIKGFLHIFSKTYLTDKQSEMLGSIRLSSDMLLHTLNDTLDAAKMESGEFNINNEPFNPDFTLRQVIDSMSFSATKKKLELVYSFNGDKETNVSGDGFRLKQIMVNLLSNAIKFTKNGSVMVNAGIAAKDGKTWLHVEVADTGTGISAEQQSNLFSKYYQTSSAIGKTGTGLGLYICRQLVQLQNGQISVKSTSGQGSIFSFSIPYHELATGVRAISIQSVDKPLSLVNGLKILAVDSNELNLMFMKVMTSQWNIRFFEASTGTEALAIIQQERVDIVLTDIKLSDMSAQDLINAARELDFPLNAVPFIATTSSDTGLDADERSKSYFSGFISKPFTEAELMRQIFNALNPDGK